MRDRMDRQSIVILLQCLNFESLRAGSFRLCAVTARLEEEILTENELVYQLPRLVLFSMQLLGQRD